MEHRDFLPVSRQQMVDRGWYYYDFLVVTGDAYVDHPSFGTAIISRVLEAEGYRVAILSQPDWHSAQAFLDMGRPRYGVMIGGGNIDSMVAHYTVSKKRRTTDSYSPGGEMGHRPDRPTIVYANRAREAFPGLPIVIGGLEASLRRFAHYDYWDDKVRRSILYDAQADFLVYGMGERATREIAKRLAAGEDPSTMTNIRGTAVAVKSREASVYPIVDCPSFEEVCANKRSYAEATKIQYDEHDPIRGKAILQPHGESLLLINPPAKPLKEEELDFVAELPYMRAVHPMYDSKGGVPAIEEVKYSVTHNRGCFGGCNFCSLAFHQGRMITCRSEQSVLKEIEAFTHDPEFKGYVHDVGGPSANFRHTSCKQQLKNGMCKGKSCLAPTPCKNLDPDHSAYLELLRKARAIPGVKKVFIRSGIRYDYMLQDKNGEFFAELVRHHVSGQLKVAPEHCADSVLDYMGKPHFDVYLRFQEKYRRLNDRYDKEQYLVPYLISSHPGCTLQDMVKLAEYLNSTGRQPEQVQDFYPTPGTLSTCMYYTGIDPRDMQPVYVPVDPHEKAMQRALLQWKKPEKRRLVIEALHRAGREDLIGYGKNCLIRPLPGEGGNRAPQRGEKTPARGKAPAGKSPARGEGRPSAKRGGSVPTGESRRGKSVEKSARPTKKAGWAVAKPKAGGTKGRKGKK